MTRYMVDSEEVAQATASLRATMARIQSDVSAMHGRLTALQGSWTGSAAAGFQGVVNDWHGTQQRVEQSLAAIGTALDQAGQRYAETEAANARMFSG